MIRLILRPNLKSQVKVNLRAKGKQYSKDEELCVNDSCEGVFYITIN